MKYEKIICWGPDQDLLKMVSEEFPKSEIVLVLNLDDFKKAVTNDSLNLLSSANFDDLGPHNDIDGIVSFVQLNPQLEFHIIVFLDREGENGGLRIGYLERNCNVHAHLYFFKQYSTTIQKMIELGL